ncbi:MAG: saccharopine dehydrogenase NADP-binding domain-containing protein [Bacteroidetes bacterium]|nr:saccharopine dehydrogenase NADP-binding domain-containing protein [Bacteroidota bacterium]
MDNNSNNPSTFLIYGCNGYTGKLITEMAVKRGLKPILAGRSKDKVEELAKQYSLDHLVFDLEDEEKIEKALNGRVKAVLHCAGPFSRTAKKMVKACLKTCHYIDITGEMIIFEALQSYDKAAKEKGIMILPGAGYDVVPSDCLALYLKNKMPSAKHLELAIMTRGGGISHGTAKSIIENISKKSAIRLDGKILKVPHAYASRHDISFPFRNVMSKSQKRHDISSDDISKNYTGVTVPLGDLFSAYISTGIPNITTYFIVKPAMIKWMKLINYFGWLFANPLIHNFAKNRITQNQPGPTEEQRNTAQSYVWGEVGSVDSRQLTVGNKEKSNIIRAVLKLPDAYTLTALTSLKIIEKILSGNFKPGYQTPATAYGEELIMEIEGVERMDL